MVFYNQCGRLCLVQFFCFIVSFCLADILPLDYNFLQKPGQSLTPLVKPICPRFEEGEIYFSLYTRNHSEQPCLLAPGNRANLQQCNFNVNEKTELLIHGWRTNGSQIFQNMKNAYLKETDANVIVLDWSVYSPCEYTFISVSIVPKLASAVNDIIKTIIDYGTSSSLVHLVGHSIGAHVAGIAGKQASAPPYGPISRITGLDAAFPLYDFYPDDRRLTYTDADFVDAIHTSPLGTKRKVGFVNFWPNGGDFQPGCSEISINCDHRRSAELFTESITRDKVFRATQCDSYGNYIANKCRGNNELLMGEHCVKPKERGDYYLKTNAEPPYAIP